MMLASLIHRFRPASTPVYRVILGDICRQEVDAVVNAADDTLLGGTGVDGALREAAGPELSKACARLGGLHGNPKHTPGFRLPAKWVIHAAAPVYVGVQPERQLADVFTASVMHAGTIGAATLAFPLLGAGVFGWPADMACNAAVAGVKRGAASTPGLKEIRLVAFSKQHAALLSGLLSVGIEEEKGVRRYHTGWVD